jgi:Fe-S oxidoreductase
MKKTRSVFIPGCSLSSYQPELVKRTLEYLQEKLPGTGAILECCGKPTKALGEIDSFHQRYGRLQKEIDRMGAEEIIVCCQSCFLTVSEASKNQRVRSLWEVLPEIGLPREIRGKGEGSEIVFTVHDSCSTRDVDSIHDGIRWILDQLGYRWVDPPHSRRDTRCCGFGGMVVPANPELALRVMEKRVEEFETEYVVAYCAACRESMAKAGRSAVHILDLVFGPRYEVYSLFPGLPSGSVESWKNRYRAKKYMQRALS